MNASILRQFRSHLIKALVTGALSACTVATRTGTASVGTDPLSDLAKFNVADLQAADADAVAHNDQISHACYPALIQFVQSIQGGTPSTTVAGAFSAFQKARDVRLTVQGGLPAYLKIGCSPLVMDEQLLLARLAVIGAGGALLAPAAPALLLAPKP